jgi:hypothetical protein
MPFTIHKLPPNPPDVPFFIATERLALTADRSRVVPYEDVEAAFLFCFPGQQIPMSDAKKYGLVVETEVTEEPSPEVKELLPAETKDLQPREKKKKKS